MKINMDKKITVRVLESDIERLKAIADSENKTFSRLIRETLKDKIIELDKLKEDM